MDAEKLVLAELAERRARLQELLRLIRREAAREAQSSEGPGRPVCKRLAGARARKQQRADPISAN